jgi:Raf kinase inhibitor-like YbhB/YbcL family protein
MSFILKSSSFENNGEIPARYTCAGDDISPPLSWENIPEQTRSLVLIVDDPDAPDPKAPKMTWVHWVLYNIPADINVLAEQCTSATLPTGAAEGLNDWQRSGYGGPCPPIGRHRYFFKLYALDAMLDGLHMPTKADVEVAMQEHIIAQTQLMGTCQK